jgi:hypothetical protein
MAAKKNTTHTTSRMARKVPKRKLAKTDNRPTEGSAPADLVLAATAETAANPAVAAPAAEAAADATAGSSRIDTPLSDEETTTTADSSPKATTPANSLSALDAAAKVLGETGQSLGCQELIAAMAAKGYWHSPKGRTPAATLYSALLRELQTKGDQSRFRKTGRGKFTLRPTV